VTLEFGVTGASELADTMDAVASGLDSLELADLARTAETLARRFAPQDTGRLARSLTGRHADNRVTVATSLPYAPAVNYGVPRRGIRATHFMQRVDGAIEADVTSSVSAAVERLVGRA